MKFIITIDTSNEAFQPDWREEANRILEELSIDLQDGYIFQSDLDDQFCGLYDINGNNVGTAQLVES